MKTNSLFRAISMLAVPLTVATACGGQDQAGPVDTRQADHAQLTRLEIVSEDFAALHPVEIEVELDVDGPAFETDLIIAVQTADGEDGCVLGAMKVDHAVDGDEHLVLAQEFIVNGGCWPLTERDDAKLFASFDPWQRLGDGSTNVFEEADVRDGNLLGVMQLSRMATDDCATCETDVVVMPSPGLDAQLREVNVSSAVAVLPVPAEGGLRVAPGPDSDVMVSSRLRVTGLDKAQGLEPGEVWMSHQVRPLGSDDSAWVPLADANEANFDDSGNASEVVDVTGPHDVNRVASLSLAGQAADALVDGAWSDIHELELMTCVHTGFDQALYEDGPRDNDCAILPLAIARVPMGADGKPVALAAGANARSAESWSKSWGKNNSTFGYSGVDFDVWLDVNASDGPSQTYGGREVLSAGSWFEAGALSTATVFDLQMTLLDLYATFIGYDSGGGGVAMKASIFLTDFIDPIELQIADGVPVTLQDIFDFAGLDIDPSFSMEYVIAGVDFDDGCGNVTAATKAVGTIGIDTEETSVTVTSQPNGVEVQGTITPYLDIAAVAETSVSYGEYLSGGVSVTLSLLNISIPFTVVAEYTKGLGSHQLDFNEYASAVVNILSGDISYYISYKIPWPLCWANCTKTHEGTLLEWNGYTVADIELFNLTQSVSWDDDPSVCGNNTCEWDEGTSCLADCGPEWMYADRVTIDENWTRVDYPYSFTNPVVIVGPPTYNGSDPSVVRVRNVTSDSFEVRIQEYAYLDGDHTDEMVSWMVLEEGTHNDPNGEGHSVWEVGTSSVSDATTQLSFTYANTLDTPMVFASTQTFSGGDPIALRMMNVTSGGADVFLQEEEGTGSPVHNSEGLGYVAIFGSPTNWANNGFAYQLWYQEDISLDENWQMFATGPNYDVQLMCEEEESLDTEVAHANESVDLLRFGHAKLGQGKDIVFAQADSFNGSDTMSLRAIYD